MALGLQWCSHISCSADQQSPDVTIYRVLEGTSVLPSILLKWKITTLCTIFSSWLSRHYKNPRGTSSNFVTECRCAQTEPLGGHRLTSRDRIPLRRTYGDRGSRTKLAVVHMRRRWSDRGSTEGISRRLTVGREA